MIYHFHLSQGYKKRVHPLGDKSIPERGILSTRSPCRPNPIGVTAVKILSMKGNRIRFTGLDALNGTPILDIKPYEEHLIRIRELRRSEIRVSGRSISYTEWSREAFVLIEEIIVF